MLESSRNDTTADPATESHGREVATIVFTLIAWGILFAGGVIIDSSPYRNRLASTAYTPFLHKVGCWFVVITTFTLTNVGLPACLASVLGADGHRLKVGLSEDTEEAKDGRKHPYAAAVIGGFFVYLAAVSGILILVERPWASPTAEQYVRLAGFISLLPRMLSRFLARLAEMSEGLAKPSREKG